MKKQGLALMMAAVLTVTALAGCGNSGTGTDTGSEATESTANSPNSAGKTEMEVEGDDVTTLNVWTFIELHQSFYTEMA
ncbi:MAG: ABC transporter substrate-binding protein, partial [Lachnospiraceae bacterium]